MTQLRSVKACAEPSCPDHATTREWCQRHYAAGRYNGTIERLDKWTGPYCTCEQPAWQSLGIYGSGARQCLQCGKPPQPTTNDEG